MKTEGENNADFLFVRIFCENLMWFLLRAGERRQKEHGEDIFDYLSG